MTEMRNFDFDFDQELVWYRSEQSLRIKCTGIKRTSRGEDDCSTLR